MGCREIKGSTDKQIYRYELSGQMEGVLCKEKTSERHTEVVSQTQHAHLAKRWAFVTAFPFRTARLVAGLAEAEGDRKRATKTKATKNVVEGSLNPNMAGVGGR